MVDLTNDEINVVIWSIVAEKRRKRELLSLFQNEFKDEIEKLGFGKDMERDLTNTIERINLIEEKLYLERSEKVTR